MAVADELRVLLARRPARAIGAIRARPLDVLIPVGIFASAATLYVRTMTPGLGGGIDSAEFQHAAHDLSIVHPTGYPLYLLVARAFIAIVPFGEVAWRVNLLSALYCAGAIVLVYLIAKEVSGSRWAGLLAAGLVATHPLVWQQATIAEVNSLNLLLVAGLLYALLRWARAIDERVPPLEVAGLLFGLALANHRVSLFALPGAIVFVGWAVRDGRALRLATVARTIGAVLLPLLLYLYIPLRAETTAWYENSWDNFWAVAGGESAWPVIRETIQRPLLPRVRIVFESIAGESGDTPLAEGHVIGVLLLSGLALLALTILPWWRDPAWRRAVPGLLAPTPATVAGVMVIYDVDVIGDYLSMAVMVVAILAALGVAAAVGQMRQAVAAGAPSTIGAVSRAAAIGVWIALLAGVIWQGLAIQPRMDRSDDRSAEDYWDVVQSWEGTPAEVAQRALLISPWNRVNELRYLQSVEGWRPDLEAVLLNDLVVGGRLDLIDEWLGQGRPVYLLEATPDVLDHFLAERQPPLWRITERGAVEDVAMEHALDVRFGEHVRLLGYTLRPERPTPGGQLRITLFWEAEGPIRERYVVFTHLIDGAGDKIGQRDDEPGRGFRPTTEWQPGETIADSLLMGLDPAAPPGRYRLMVGMYARVGETRLPASGPNGAELGDYWQMTEIDVGP